MFNLPRLPKLGVAAECTPRRFTDSVQNFEYEMDETLSHWIGRDKLFSCWVRGSDLPETMLRLQRAVERKAGRSGKPN